jgi:5-methylcytosine-specific restriction endonuclease McrA
MLKYINSIYYKILNYIGKGRSGAWKRIRAYFLTKEPECQWCLKTYDLDVHHIVPYHINPELELKLTNLITLCRNCHFEHGHMRNWSKYDIEIRKKCNKNQEKIYQQLKLKKEIKNEESPISWN